VNSKGKGLKPHTLLIRDKEGNTITNKVKILQRWFEYYKKHFELQDGTCNGSGKEWEMYIQMAELYVEPPKDVDKEMAISKLKNGKTTGHD
jgi:hypothetical protein